MCGVSLNGNVQSRSYGSERDLSQLISFCISIDSDGWVKF